MKPVNLQWLLAFAALLWSVVQWQRWKRRARRCERNHKAWKDALHSVGFEATNAVNAIRANLLDFREMNPSVAMPEHLDEIETGTRRIAEILKIVDDPVGWHLRRNANQGEQGQQSLPG